MNDDLIHYVQREEQPRKPGMSVAPVVYLALCGAEWKSITDIPAKVTCPDCEKLMKGSVK